MTVYVSYEEINHKGGCCPSIRRSRSIEEDYPDPVPGSGRGAGGRRRHERESDRLRVACRVNELTSFLRRVTRTIVQLPCEGVVRPNNYRVSQSLTFLCGRVKSAPIISHKLLDPLCGERVLDVELLPWLIEVEFLIWKGSLMQCLRRGGKHNRVQAGA